MILLLAFITWGLIEWHRHLHYMNQIPNRIIINGTRGKSSVTRLIAAGLKAGGFRVLAKTTGTKPRLILNNETEQPVVRIGRANIREQIGIMREAVRRDCDTVVFENMSLRPDLQYIEESRLVQPTVAVITNVRSDHLDVMGPTLQDIARHFIAAVPTGTTVITAEQELLPALQDHAARKSIRLIAARHDTVCEEEMSRFPYFEHRENVALALEVCRHLGIEREQALNGIIQSRPDPGALRIHQVLLNGHRVSLYNALAANDPDSTLLIYERIGRPRNRFQVLINCRNDRIDRSLQIADMIARDLPADIYYVCGRETAPLIRRAVRQGVPREKFIVLEGWSFEDIRDEIGRRIADDSVLLAIGNIVGYGEQLIDYLTRKDEP